MHSSATVQGETGQTGEINVWFQLLWVFGLGYPLITLNAWGLLSFFSQGLSQFGLVFHEAE